MLFEHGSYQPLLARGVKMAHICAFARDYWREQALVVVPQLVAALTGGELRPPIAAEVWQDTWLVLPQANASDEYRNEFTGEIVQVVASAYGTSLPLGTISTSFPVALLTMYRKSDL